MPPSPATAQSAPEPLVRPRGRSAAVAAPPVVVCIGVAAWKREAVSRLLSQGTRDVAHVRSASEAVRIARRERGAIAVWSSRTPPALQGLAADARTSVAQIEDGFIRSAGLGAECRPPASIVLDHSGIHFDPSRPSDLETLLARGRFDPALLRRSERLVSRIAALGVTKYNLRGANAPLPPEGRRTVLVPGQVEDDLSVRLGGAGVAGNLDLLRRARAQEPDAVILYRPHPDVEGGHRHGRLSDRQALRFADQVVRGHDLPSLLAGVDAVHVLTSLTGFEALIRGREVVVHGQPFYAGWGLTRDLAPPPRRGRRLTLAELAAAALILYPLYLDPLTGAPCDPETVVASLGESARPAPGLLPLLRRAEAGVRRLAGVHPRRRAGGHG